jgi:hypothetical protein
VASRKPTREDLRPYQSNYLAEMDGIALYGALAAVENDKKRAAIFARLARAEELRANLGGGRQLSVAGFGYVR